MYKPLYWCVIIHATDTVLRADKPITLLERLHSIHMHHSFIKFNYNHFTADEPITRLEQVENAI